MATKQGTVQKIYDLRTLGYDQIHAQLQQITKDFDQIRKAKLDASKAIADTKDTQAIQKYSDEIENLKIQEQSLRVQRQQMINEAKAAQILRDQENRSLKDQQKNVKAAAGSYNELYQQYRQLYQLVKSTPKGQAVDFQGQTLQFDQAIGKLKELAAAEQDFRRQFARDGLLVAEYTSGIIQAFQKADLGDLVGGQISKAEQSLAGINTQFEQLKNEFNQAKATGVGDLQAIEAQLIENRKEAVNLTSQISSMKEQLKGTGSVGDTVTKGIASGFKNIKDQLGGFVLAFVGIQTVLTKLEGFGESAKEEFSQAEESVARFDASLKNLGRESEFDELNNNINKLSAQFKSLDNDDIRNATTSLVLFGKLTADQIKQILPVIIDFAAQQRKTVAESTEIFIKAIEGSDKPLKQFGLNLKDASTEEGKFGVLVNDLGGKIKGTADEFEKSTTGAMAKNRQQWKDLAEDVGKKVIPVLTSVAAIVVNVVAALLNIPFPLLVAGLTAVTAALALYKAEQIRSYVVTQIATKQGLIYNAYLIAQRIVTLATAAATRIATAEIVLFNGAIRISPIGIFLTLLGLIVPAVALWANKLKEARQETNALKTVNEAASRIYVDQVSKISALVNIVKSAVTSLDTKKKAVTDLIAIDKEFSNVVKNNVIDLNELDRAYRKVTEAIELQARAQASAQLTAEKQQKVVEVEVIRQTIERALAEGSKDLSKSISDSQLAIIRGLPNQQALLAPGASFTAGEDAFSGEAQINFKNVLKQLKEEEDRRAIELQKYQEIKNKADEDLNKFIESNKTQAAATEIDIKALRAQIEKLDSEIQDFQGTKADLDKKVKQRDDLQKKLDDLLQKSKKTVTGPSKLSADIQDQIKDIEALRDRMLADEEIKRQQNQQSETAYLKNVLLINEIAIDKKLAIIKGANEEERKTIAQLNLEKLKDIQDTNDKIFDIQRNALKAQLDQQIANINLERDQQLQDPTLSETERAKIKLDADKQILDLQIQFNEDINRLEKLLAQQSLANTKESADEIVKTKKAILDDQRALDEAALKDAQAAGERSVQQFKELMAKLKLAIVQDTDLNATARNRLLNAAQGQEDIGILAREVDSLQKQLPIYKQLLADKLITDQQYSEFTTTLTNKQIELQNTLTKGISDNIEKIKSLYKGLLDSGKITKEQYDKLITDLNNTSSKGVATAAKNIKTLKDLLTGGLVNIFRINTDTASGKALSEGIGKALEQSYQLATQAMNNYFNAERDRINENLQLQEQRLDAEKEQVQARAQSQAEIDSIEKQYAAKKRQAEIAAGEQLKKTRRSEAKIAFATQLINIAVQASQYPFPASLIIAGILTALAAVNYATQLGAINRETFERGGIPGEKKKPSIAQRIVQAPGRIIEKIFSRGTSSVPSGGGGKSNVPSRGGKITGPSHRDGGVPISVKGKIFEVEGGEAIIRKKSVIDRTIRTITGTNAQILSAVNKTNNGTDFAPGAIIKRKLATGGLLGSQLQAPFFVPSSSSSGDSAMIVEELRKITAGVAENSKTNKQLAAEQSARIDRLEVTITERKITKAQEKQIKQASIGTL